MPKIIHVSLLAIFLLVSSFSFSYSAEPHWSVCSSGNGGICMNGISYDDCTFASLRPTGVSVKGLWIFFNSGWETGPEGPGLAEFVFQERVGDYYTLTETSANISCLKRMGGEDIRTPALTLVSELELIQDNAGRYFESWDSVNDCRFSVKSLAINGAERWELFRNTGNSVCIQVENTTSFVPGIVRDVRTLGIQHGQGNICGFVRGCSKSPADIVKIPNSQTSGVLRR